MENNEKKKTPLIIVLSVVLIIIGCVVGWLLGRNFANKTNKTVNDNTPKSGEIVEINLDNETKKLYKSLITSSGEFGLYFNENVNIDNISAEKMIEFVLEEYVKNNNTPMMGEFSVCLEDLDFGKFTSEDCLNNLNKFTIKKADIDNLIKSKFNTNRVFTLNKDGNSNYVSGNINGWGTGGYIYDFSKNVYYVGLIAKSGGESNIFTNLIKVEKDENNIYFYDNAFYCMYDFISMSCSSKFSNEYPDDEDALAYYYEEDEKNKNVKFVNKKDDDGEEYKEAEVDAEKIFSSLKDKLNTYKHTFKKGNDGKYYWYSSEIIK